MRIAPGLLFAAVLAGWLPVAPAHALTAAQPTVELAFSTAILGLIGYPDANPDTTRAGAQPVAFSDSWSAPLPPTGFANGCSGSAAGIAGVGMPAASAAVDSVSAFAQCPGPSDATFFTSDARAQATLLYKIKGPGALFSSTPVSLFAHLHGKLSASNDGNGSAFSQLDFTATGANRLDGTNLLGGLASLKSQPGFPFILGGDLSGLLVDRSSGSTSIFEIDQGFQTDFTVTGYLASVNLRLFCEAQTKPGGIGTPVESAGCEADFGDSSAYLHSNAPSVILERVAPLRPTTPRSAVYLSPAGSGIQTIPGTPGLPTTASGSGSLGEGATGGGTASADLPLLNPQLAVSRSGVSSYVDLAAITANGDATVASEGQGAVSLRYHLTRLNGFSGNPHVKVTYPSVDFALSATKGLDPSVLERSSFELSVSVQGQQFFHFVTLTLGSSNEDPPGVSGDWSFSCLDESTATMQACHLSSSSPSLDESPVPIIPDAHDEIVLTVQTDCSTSLAHPSGPLPEAHPACDASHTVVAALESVDANAVLTPVPEADARALAGACAGALAVLRRGKRSSRPRAGTWIS